MRNELERVKKELLGEPPADDGKRKKAGKKDKKPASNAAA